MTKAITIRHPYPALYVPRGGRNVVGGLFQTETSAMIRRADGIDRIRPRNGWTP